MKERIIVCLQCFVLDVWEWSHWERGANAVPHAAGEKGQLPGSDRSSCYFLSCKLPSLIPSLDLQLYNIAALVEVVGDVADDVGMAGNLTLQISKGQWPVR